MNMDRHRAVVLVSIVLLLGVLVTSTVGLAAGDPVDQVVTVRSSYDETTPSQAIEVVVIVRAETTTLTNVKVHIDPGQRALVRPDSYSTTVYPSNQGVAVSPSGPDTFTIEELKPGEEVRIALEVVPTTLKYERITAASADVRLTRHGQRLQGTVSATADLSGNPWLTAQASNRALPTLLAVVAVAVVGSVGVTAGVLRQRTRTRHEQLLDAVHGEVESVSRAGDQTVERRLNRLLETVEAHLGVDDMDAGTETDDEETSFLQRFRLGGDDRNQSGPNL